MGKLIYKFKLYPSIHARERLQNYLNKHPMAVCMASPNEQQFLKANGFKV